jgi:chromate transporter
MKSSNHYKEIALLFAKLGCIAFGGPAAHVAMMEEEVVSKRKWMDREHFLDLMGATNLIPGPNSTELTMHCGHERGGILGLFIAGICFIVPAVLITGFLAFLYTKYGDLPNVEPFIYGIKAAVLAIIAAAIYKLGKKALKNYELGILGVAVLIASLVFQVNEILALLAGGVIGTLYFWIKNNSFSKTKSFAPFFLFKAAGTLASTKIFLSFLKVGAILYGSGYVLFAYLDAELVATGLLSRADLMEAIAVGQFTPGPVLSTATFIGYQLGGWSGAVAASIGIFLPSFLFVALLNPLVPKMRQSKILGYFLDCVNVAAVAVMGAVLIKMGQESLSDWRSIIIAIIGIAMTFGCKKSNAMYVVLMGSLLGYLLTLV